MENKTHRLYFYGPYNALQCFPSHDSEAQEINTNFRSFEQANTWGIESGYQVIDKRETATLND